VTNSNRQKKSIGLRISGTPVAQRLNRTTELIIVLPLDFLCALAHEENTYIRRPDY